MHFGIVSSLLEDVILTTCYCYVLGKCIIHQGSRNFTQVINKGTHVQEIINIGLYYLIAFFPTGSHVTLACILI